MTQKIPSHLPKRLTISFPIWGIFDTAEGGKYHDFDKMMREHVERGFNCIRLDDGAGLTHDLNGNHRKPIYWGYAFGKYDKNLRQFGANGSGGVCDVLDRLIKFFEAAKRHNVFVILSSWYYLHTSWYVKDSALNHELHSIDPLDRFISFAKFLDYIICELKERGLEKQIAFAEIFNEADGLRFINGYDENNLSDEEIDVFRKKHQEAIDFLKERHPDILFGFDSWTYYTDLRQLPDNIQVYNFHNYFLWSVYEEALENDTTFLINNPISIDEIRAASKCDYPPTDDWYQRAWFYSNLDPDKLDLAREKMISYLKENIDSVRKRFSDSMLHLKENMENNLPSVPVVCGEGVSYCGGYSLVWEEYSEEYWTLIKEMVQKHRDLELWGTVIRTCCGPEDPVWDLCPDKLLEMNKIFLGNNK